MSAGLPATGVGGALYLLLIVWMLLRELTRTATGPSSDRPRWPFIGKMVFILLAMVVAVLGERLLVNGALESAALYIPGLAKFLIVPSVSFVLLMGAMPFVILLLIMGCLHGLRLCLRPRPSVRSDPSFGSSPCTLHMDSRARLWQPAALRVEQASDQHRS
jgi:hypothetical protein